MTLTATVRQLEAWLQEELGAREALLIVLEAQGEALLQGDIDRVEACTAALEEAASAALARGLRRDPLLERLGEAFGVAAGTLTVGSVVERLGAEGARLAKLRAELLASARAEAAQARRNASFARAQAQATTEILSVLIGGPDGGAPGEVPGGLINANA